MQSVTLFEYQRYPYECSERDEFKEGTLYLTERTLTLMEELNRTQPFIETGLKSIRPLNYAGVLRVGDLSIQILPKLFRNGNLEDHHRIISTNLLKMLSYTGNVPIKEISVADLSVEAYDFFEIFMHLFAKHLLHTIKSSQRREYIRTSDDLRVIKGRIDFAKHTNPARMHIIPCRYYEFSTDNLMNRTLKFTCHLMARTASDFGTVRMLRSITDILDQVTLTPVTVPEIDRIAFTRLNRMFEPYIRMCRLFLAHSTLTLQASDVESFSLLIPMERLFEEFITEVLREDPAFFFGRPIHIESQRSVGKLVTDEDGSELFNLRPDILVGYPHVEAIIDTKYKLLDATDRRMKVSQSDVYQMYAYATKTTARKIMLLYPDILLDHKRDFLLSVPSPEGENRDVPLLIRAIRLSYDLNERKEWGMFREELRGIVRGLLSEEENTLSFSTAQVSLQTVL